MHGRADAGAAGGDGGSVVTDRMEWEKPLQPAEASVELYTLSVDVERAAFHDGALYTEKH